MSACQSEPMGARNWEPEFTPTVGKFEIRPEIIELIMTGFRPSYYVQGEPYYPTICVCAVCSGVTGACSVRSADGQTWIEPTKEEAFMLALAEHGMYVEKWKGHNVGNSNHFPHLCECACQHVWRETSRPPTPRSGIHTSRCIKCGITNMYDTSD